MNDLETVEYVLEEQIGFKLRLAYQRHAEMFAATLPGVTPTQFATMAKLRESGTLSQNHLGRLVAMDAATTKGVIDRLRKKGLVQATPSTTDLRRLDVSLTETGRMLIDTSLQHGKQISAATTRNLTRREEAQLLALLDKL